MCNKKVLLRERKRHTARRVASTHCAALCPGGGGGLPPTGRMVAGVGAGGNLLQPEMGAPTCQLGWGYPPSGCEQTDTCENSTFPIPSECGR